MAGTWGDGVGEDEERLDAAERCCSTVFERADEVHLRIVDFLRLKKTWTDESAERVLES